MGEYSRCHIPRLVIEDEGEQEEAMKNTREEENNKRELLDQLDDVWEQNRRAELGSGAIMGPKSSPQKRVDTTAPQGAKKRRRRTLKYPTIGEDWGEQEPPTLAEEQSVLTTPPPHTGSPNNAGEQGIKRGHLFQPLILGYLTPDRVPSTGGPCEKDQILERTTFEIIGNNCGGDREVNTQLALGTTEKIEDVRCDDRVLVERNRENDCVSTLPPSENSCQLDERVLKTTTFSECEEDAESMKSEGPLGGGDMNVEVENERAGGVTSTAEKDPIENDCVWGVRGFCKTHRMYGKKYSTSSKDWKKKKDGTFGWTYRKKTNYTCTGVRGVGDTSSPALITLGISHAIITARISGMEKQTSGQQLSGFVGGDYRAI